MDVQEEEEEEEEGFWMIQGCDEEEENNSAAARTHKLTDFISSFSPEFLHPIGRHCAPCDCFLSVIFNTHPLHNQSAVPLLLITDLLTDQQTNNQ